MALERLSLPLAAVARAARRPQTLPAQVREVASTLVTASMWPFGFGGAEPARLGGGVESLPTAHTGRPSPVLLVHGFAANRSNWLAVRRHLGQAGYGEVDALNYNPFTHDIDEVADQVAERVDLLRRRTGCEHVHLIGHSLGGIIARYAVQVTGVEGVRVVATVASPHQGMRLARHGRRLGLGIPAAGVSLAPGSPVMQALRTTARSMSTHFVAYYSNLDMIVPGRRAMIREPELDAVNILVKDHGHLSVMLSRRLAASLVAQLAGADGVAGYASITGLASRRDRAPADLAPAVGQ